MGNSWENYEPAPLEFFHSILLDMFHEFRKTKTNGTDVFINGNEFGNIIAKAKLETYKRYPKQLNNKAILKTEL